MNSYGFIKIIMGATRIKEAPAKLRSEYLKCYKDILSIGVKQANSILDRSQNSYRNYDRHRRESRINNNLYH